MEPSHKLIYGVNPIKSTPAQWTPFALVLTGSNSLVGIDNARDLPQKRDQEGEIQTDFSLKVPSTDRRDKADLNLLVFFRGAFKNRLILQVPLSRGAPG